MLETAALAARVDWRQAPLDNREAMGQRLMEPLDLAAAVVVAQGQQLLQETLAEMVEIMALAAAAAVLIALETTARLALANRASSSFPTPQQALSKQSALQAGHRLQLHPILRLQTL